MIWHSGAPPAIGWWVASRKQDKLIWRWWNGVCWSLPVPEGYSAKKAAQYAAIPDTSRWTQIEWTDYWPENARVPRPPIFGRIENINYMEAGHERI